jgi:hypothetical protein
MENKVICLIRDAEHEVIRATTDVMDTALMLTVIHNEVVANGVKPNEEFPDSLSGWHCSIWSEDGEVLAVYGEEGSLLCEGKEISANEVLKEMYHMIGFTDKFEG